MYSAKTQDAMCLLHELHKKMPHLLLIHDSEGSGHHNVTELTRGQKVISPLLDLAKLNVEPW